LGLLVGLSPKQGGIAWTLALKSQFPLSNEYRSFSLGIIDTTICLSNFTNDTSMPVKDVKMYSNVG
jgi:hypothetical protein